MNIVTHTTSENDLPGLETHEEIRHCQYCKADTPHRVGINKQHYETANAIYDLEDEYAHCQCGNTATVSLKKSMVKKDKTDKTA